MTSVFRVRAAALLLALTSVFVASAPTGSAAQGSESRDFEWSDEVIELFATLPVQDGGRVKPLDSLAGLNLLMMNGKRTLKAGIDWAPNADGEMEAARTEKLKPSAWLLDCFFYPDQAKDYHSFRVQDAAVLTALGLESRKKRDWYSFNELKPGLQTLQLEARKAFDTEAAKRSSKERQVIKLDQDVGNFMRLVAFLDPLRREYSTGSTQGLVDIFGIGKTKGVAGILERQAELQELRLQASLEPGDDFKGIQTLLTELEAAMRFGGGSPAIIPPHAAGENTEQWWEIGDLIRESFGHSRDHSEQIAVVRSLETLDSLRGDPVAFQAELTSLHDVLKGQADARDEYGHIAMEVGMYRTVPFFKAKWIFVFSFLLLAVSWLVPRSKPLWYAVGGFAGISTAYLVYGIVLRCIIRGRPPVVTLYDTILFVSACAILVAFFTEWLTRQRVAMAGAILVGVMGMFLADLYEFKEIASAGDTMASVVAVLDTNFYLAIHVTTIAMGYSGGLLAAVIAHAWILGKLLGFKKGDKAFYKSIYKMTYGVVCFSLLFSIFGTIMGGIWANDSWGRFWGWDPKENGALLICIWQLLILHMRLGGFVRERGFAVMSVIGGAVVSASWWGVNLLNVGLHSYGFTSGVALILGGYWLFELIIISISGIDHLMRKTTGGGSAA